MITCTRSIEFDAGHRLVGHESKCANLHGHRYRAEFTVRTVDGLDNVGRVVDFGIIKQLMGGWIDEYWDHNMVLNSQDPLLQMFDLEDDGQGQGALHIPAWYNIFGRQPYIMACNPTAENMARYLAEIARTKFEGTAFRIVRVRLYETPNCWADWVLANDQV